MTKTPGKMHRLDMVIMETKVIEIVGGGMAVLTPPLRIVNFLKYPRLDMAKICWCFFYRFFCSLTIKIFFPKKKR